MLPFRQAQVVVEQKLGFIYHPIMAWSVALKESVVQDLRWFGKKQGRAILQAASAVLADDPGAETRNLKTLRPNPFAQRELRLLGKYRILFNLDKQTETVTILAVGEKRGNSLLVQGKEFTQHHEDHPAD